MPPTVECFRFRGARNPKSSRRSIDQWSVVSCLPAGPVSYLTCRFIGGIVSILSSNVESAPDSPFFGDQLLSGVPDPSPPIPLRGPPPPSQKYCPPSAMEEANVDGALRLPTPSSHSVLSASAPTPITAMSSQDNIDTFIHALSQELYHSPKYAQLHVQYSSRLYINMHPSVPRSCALSSETTSQRAYTMVLLSSASKRR